MDEDQVAWRAAKLYQLVTPRSTVEVLGDRAPTDGYGSPVEPTVGLELGELVGLKLAAISRHVSQTGSAGPFHDWGADARDAYLATEHYRLAASALPAPIDGEGGPVRRPALTHGRAARSRPPNGELSPVHRHPRRRVPLAGSALALAGLLLVVGAALGGGGTTTVEGGVYLDYVAPDPLAPTDGAIRFGFAGTLETIAADAVLAPPADTNLAFLGGAPTCLGVTREGGVITALEFAGECNAGGTVTRVDDLFGPGGDAYLIADRVAAPADLVEGVPAFATLIGIPAVAGTNLDLVFVVDLATGIPSSFIGQTSVTGPSRSSPAATSASGRRRCRTRSSMPRRADTSRTRRHSGSRRRPSSSGSADPAGRRSDRPDRAHGDLHRADPGRDARPDGGAERRRAAGHSHGACDRRDVEAGRVPRAFPRRCGIGCPGPGGASETHRLTSTSVV